MNITEENLMRQNTNPDLTRNKHESKNFKTELAIPD